MNEQQKQRLLKWQSAEEFRLPDASKIKLDDLIKQTRNKHNLVNEYTIPMLLNAIHPVLYFYFVIDWSKFPASRVPQGFKDGISFGRHITDEWLRVCNRYGYFRTGLLENYDTIDQLRNNIDSLLRVKASGLLYYPDGFDRMEEQLNIMRDNDIEHEAELEAERLAKEEADRQQREAEAKRREEEEAKKKKKKQAEHEAEAQSNREFHDKEGSPWTQNNTSSPEAPMYEVYSITTAPLKHTAHAGPGSSIEKQMYLLQSDYYEFYKLITPDLRTIHLDVHYSGQKHMFTLKVHAYAMDEKNSRTYTTGRQPSFADCLINAENHLLQLISDHEAKLNRQREAEERQKQKDAIQKKIDEAKEQMQIFQEQQMAEISKMQEKLNSL